ncbi:SDR family NAD(P)-dependent oxidoreductase [Flavicella sediminum]|uniref:SDR family NAD(P)-dependent oxidoreductase n=1 Tax=Flavicella sediminum TaxID=2585141 RepID=UPI00140B5DDC|nr:SDR family NAD(P)-dependent oxidoreductase [Flavicella sediminum]
MKNIIVITGGSKGIGKALAKKYADNDYLVFSIARNTCPINDVHSIQGDLSNPENIEAYFTSILQIVNLKKVSSFTLILNAGSLGTIGNIEKNPLNSIQKTVQLNLTGPLLFSSIFIEKLKEATFEKKIISISSGAAIKPYAGWSVYCSTKAGVDMMTRTIAEEQKTLVNGVKVNAIYPGVVETNMQETIRNSPEKDFKNVQRFIDLKEKEELYTPDFVADKIYNLDCENVLETGAIVDLRNL